MTRYNKTMREALNEVYLVEKVDKKLALKILSMNKNQKFVKASGDFVPEIYLSGMDRDALKKEFGRLPRGLPNASNGVPVVDFINHALGLDNEIDTEDGDKPQPKLYDYRTGKVIGKPKTVGDAARMAGLRLEGMEHEEEILNESVDEKFQSRGYTTKQVKMAIGIASDPRYKGGNYTGAYNAIEKIKKGLANHPQVAAVLKRQNEEVEIDEMKMDDPKLVKHFDKLKRGDTVKLKTSSTISKGTDFVDYVVKAKNTVNKGRVEKITLVTKGNEKAVKKFLYKRDGKVTFAIGDMGASIDDIKEAAHALAEKLKVSDGVGAWIKDFQKSDAPQFQGKSEEDRKKMAIAAFADAGGKLEETELDEGMKYTHAAVDKKGLVIGFASDEKDAKDMAKRNDGKVVKLKKPMSDKKGDMMVNRPFKEEDEKKMDKPDSAKAVDQMRDDKKKTRIAQLQLQIAKATEMINKLNSQEKPDA